MATSPNKTIQCTSEQFAESCGAVLFNLSTPQKRTVCLIHYHAKTNGFSPRAVATAVDPDMRPRCVNFREEAGYSAHLHPVTMSIRAPPRDEQGHMPDKPHPYTDLTEPFMVTMRQLGGEGTNDVKISWWYIAALDEGVSGAVAEAEEEFSAQFFPLEEAVQKLSFQNDRTVLQKAISLVDAC